MVKFSFKMMRTYGGGKGSINQQCDTRNATLHAHIALGNVPTITDLKQSTRDYGEFAPALIYSVILLKSHELCGELGKMFQQVKKWPVFSFSPKPGVKFMNFAFKKMHVVFKMINLHLK